MLHQLSVYKLQFFRYNTFGMSIFFKKWPFRMLYRSLLGPVNVVWGLWVGDPGSNPIGAFVFMRRGGKGSTCRCCAWSSCHPAASRSCEKSVVSHCSPCSPALELPPWANLLISFTFSLLKGLWNVLYRQLMWFKFGLFKLVSTSFIV